MSSKEQKKNQLRELFLSVDEWTKPSLAKKIGVSTVTINSLMEELMSDEEIVEVGKEKVDIGRPSIIYQINAPKFSYLLISIVERDQRLYLEGELVNGKGEISASTHQLFEKVEMKTLQQFVCDFLEKTGVLPLSIALSIPGKSIAGTVEISWWDKMNGWRIEETLMNEFDIPVFIENDANLATVGFTRRMQLDSARGIVGLYYPHKSRPGASIFYDGKLISGTGSLAGEVKYLPFFSSKQQDAYSSMEEMGLAVKVLELYTILLAPQYLLVHMKNVEETVLKKELAAALEKTGIPIRPELFVSEDYEEHVASGLRWLSQKELPFKMRRI